MTDYVWPQHIIPSRVRWRLLDGTASSVSATTGITRTSALYGNYRWACTLEFDNLNGDKRAYVTSLLAALRGKANRIWIPDPSSAQRGSMVAPELFTNSDFSNGTTGWTAYAATISASNGVLRSKSAGANREFGLSQTVTGVQYAPHVIRSLIPRSLVGSDSLIVEAGNLLPVNTIYAARTGYVTHSGVAYGTSLSSYPAWHDGNSDGVVRADRFLDYAFVSASRCFLADGGGNLLLRSSDFSNASWTKSATTADADIIAAPDGAVLGDRILETAVTSTHYLQQVVTVPSAVADITFSVYVRPGLTRNFCWLYLEELTGPTATSIYFDLTTGASSNSSTGANWSNLRSTATSVGNGWWRFTITARKTNAATSIAALLGIAAAAGTSSYAGNIANGLYAWGANVSATGVASRYTATTTATVAASTQTGSAIYVKGLPASTNGLLVRGDKIEIVISTTRSHFAEMTADLDSDAAGLGYMQISPPCPFPLPDNAAIIVQKPMCRMVLSESPEYETRPALFSDFSVSFEQVP